jgi:ribosomal protein S18 acetylase RimI-like enzyme
MTIYYRLLDRGVYVPDFEEDHQPLPGDMIAAQEPLRRRLREALARSGHYPHFNVSSMKSEQHPGAALAPYTLRTTIRPGDIGEIVRFHGLLYAEEYGFDPTFEAYVAEPLGAFVISGCERGRIWIAERDEKLIGCIAIVAASEAEARLRWFLVDPSARGLGLGKRLLREAVEFCREEGYETVTLSTVSSLTTAAALYRSVGFEKVEATPEHLWGTDVVAEIYAMRL